MVGYIRVTLPFSLVHSNNREVRLNSSSQKDEVLPDDPDVCSLRHLEAAKAWRTDVAVSLQSIAARS